MSTLVEFARLLVLVAVLCTAARVYWRLLRNIDGIAKGELHIGAFDPFYAAAEMVRVMHETQMRLKELRYG